MKKIQKIWLVFCIMILILGLGTISHASSGDLKMKELHYDATLLENGDMKVTEDWTIDIEDTNTLFKTFKVDSSKYKEIDGVTVEEITNSGTKNFTEIFHEQYHVDKNHFYALKKSSGEFEIAWGVQVKNSIKHYRISYTVKEAVTTYSDCAELYWQFLGTTSQIPVKQVTGKITLPNAIENIEDLRIWAHGPLNGDIKKISNQEVLFTITNLKPGEMLEVRILTPTEVYPTNTKLKKRNMLKSILTEEQNWADQANKKRESIKRAKTIYLFFVWGVGSALGLYFLWKALGKYRRILKQNPKIVAETEVEYYREFPDESASAAMASFLYYFEKGNMSTNMSKVISATLLNLCCKKHISFEMSTNGKKEMMIQFQEEGQKEKLTEDEEKVYSFIKEADEKEANVITMKQLQKYMERNVTQTNSLFQEVAKIAEKEEIAKNNYQEENKKKNSTWMAKAVGYTFVAFFSFFIFSPVLLLGLIVATIYAVKIARRYYTLTQKGVNEAELWKGLKKYMDDFSLLKEKEVPALILWEKYLVFATAFGIADKVLEQLKIYYPEITDETYLRNHGYAYLYVMYAGNRHSMIHTIDNGISSTYTKINYSSGSGGGGGFSGGGRRWRRPVAGMGGR